MLRRPAASRTRGLQLDPSQLPLPAPIEYTLSIAATKLVVTCTSPIQVTGTPPIQLTGGAHIGITTPTAMVQDSPVKFTLTYLNIVAAADNCVIPQACPGVRTREGGYLMPTSTKLV